MPTFTNDGKNTTLFIFNHIITRFIIPQAIVVDHDSHFRNLIMAQLSTKLGFFHENSSSYYLQANGQVEAINKVLKIMIQRMAGTHKSNWHFKLFSTLWDYRTFIKTDTGFTPFQLAYGLEAFLPIKCKIPSLKLAIELLPNTSTEEERFLYLTKLDETYCDVSFTNETHKNHIKTQYDKYVLPCVFEKGDLVLVYDQDHGKLGEGNLQPMWHNPYILN